ncbi:hypothetical protein TWF730_009257 [Orbilia blumenaviensis]|uniref:Uncharacterized protein n=1 Tax=Orbilia blumenaviensis TaxID=1796055 RepID=A0AAV9V0V5_9PEZI
MNPYNPDDLDTNCVFVTMSRLSDKPYQTLKNDLGLINAETGSDMRISMDTMKWWQWKIREKYHSHVQFFMVPTGNTYTSRELCQLKCEEWIVSRVGLLYEDPDNSQHAICFEHTDQGYKFRDWQIGQEVNVDPQGPAAIISIVSPP